MLTPALIAQVYGVRARVSSGDAGRLNILFEPGPVGVHTCPAHGDRAGSPHA